MAGNAKVKNGNWVPGDQFLRNSQGFLCSQILPTSDYGELRLLNGPCLVVGSASGDGIAEMHGFSAVGFDNVRLVFSEPTTGWLLGENDGAADDEPFNLLHGRVPQMFLNVAAVVGAFMVPVVLNRLYDYFEYIIDEPSERPGRIVGRFVFIPCPACGPALMLRPRSPK
jgi:hypothetical protein